MKFENLKLYLYFIILNIKTTFFTRSERLCKVEAI